MGFLSGLLQTIKSSTALKVGIGAVGIGAGALAVQSAWQQATTVDIGGHKVNLVGVATIGIIALVGIFVFMKLRK